MDIWERAHGVKVFGSHVSAHQRAPTMQGALDSQVCSCLTG